MDGNKWMVLAAIVLAIEHIVTSWLQTRATRDATTAVSDKVEAVAAKVKEVGVKADLTHDLVNDLAVQAAKLVPEPPKE
jgi:hypothetical protein